MGGYNVAIREMTRRNHDWRPIFADMIYFIEHDTPIVMCPEFTDPAESVTLSTFKEAISLAEDVAQDWIRCNIDLMGKLNIIFEGRLDWAPLENAASQLHQH